MQSIQVKTQSCRIFTILIDLTIEDYILIKLPNGKMKSSEFIKMI